MCPRVSLKFQAAGLNGARRETESPSKRSVTKRSLLMSTATRRKSGKGLLSIILKEYRPDDIYNADETGLFYRLMPDRMMEFKEVDHHSGKQKKEQPHLFVPI